MVFRLHLLVLSLDILFSALFYSANPPGQRLFSR